MQRRSELRSTRLRTVTLAAALIGASCGATAPAPAPVLSPGSGPASHRASVDDVRTPLDPASPASTAPALVFTHRGFTDAPDSPDADVVVWFELADDEPRLDVAHRVHEQLPAIFACLDRGVADHHLDASLHAAFAVRDGALTATTSPSFADVERCLASATHDVSATRASGAIGTIAFYPARFARVLPLVGPEGGRIHAGFGGCYRHESPRCGPDEDCPMTVLVYGPCAGDAGAFSRLRARVTQARSTLTSIDRLTAGGEVLFTAALPFPVAVDMVRATTSVPPDATPLDLPYVATARSSDVLVLVAAEGSMAIAIANGETRFVSPATSRDADLGWDDANGEVVSGATRCPFADSTRGRLAVRCGDRFVLVRGAAELVVLDADGRELGRKAVGDPDRRHGLRTTIDATVAGVRLRLEGRIYVR